MLLLRVEDEEKRGCYTESTRRQNAMRAHDLGGCLLTTSQHPEPIDDRGLSKAWRAIQLAKHPTISALHARFAFLSAQQFHAWFYTSSARRILKDVGLHLAVLDVPPNRVEVGTTQCVFDTNHAIRIGRLDCTAPHDTIQGVAEGRLKPWLHPRGLLAQQAA